MMIIQMNEKDTANIDKKPVIEYTANRANALHPGRHLEACWAK